MKITDKKISTKFTVPGASFMAIFYLPYWVLDPDADLEITVDYKDTLEECSEDNNVKMFKAIGQKTLTAFCNDGSSIMGSSSIVSTDINSADPYCIRGLKQIEDSLRSMNKKRRKIWSQLHLSPIFLFHLLFVSLVELAGLTMLIRFAPEVKDKSKIRSAHE